MWVGSFDPWSCFSLHFIRPYLFLGGIIKATLLDSILGHSSSVLDSLAFCLCLVLDGLFDSSLLERVIVKCDTGNLCGANEH